MQSRPYRTHVRFRSHGTGRADTIRYFGIEYSKELITSTPSTHHIVSSMGVLKRTKSGIGAYYM